MDHLVRGLRLASEHAPVGARCPGAGGSHRTERLGGRHAGGAQGLVRGGGACWGGLGLLCVAADGEPATVE
jgi:hypothetical protein